MDGEFNGNKARKLEYFLHAGLGGIKRVVCEMHYHDEKDSIDMFKQAGIPIEHVNDKTQTYTNM